MEIEIYILHWKLTLAVEIQKIFIFSNLIGNIDYLQQNEIPFAILYPGNNSRQM